MGGLDLRGQGSGAARPVQSLVSLWALGPSVPIAALVAASSGTPGRPGPERTSEADARR